MDKKYFYVFLFLFGITSYSHALNKNYVFFGYGQSHISDNGMVVPESINYEINSEIDQSYLLNLGYGYFIKNNIRIECELNYRNYDLINSKRLDISDGDLTKIIIGGPWFNSAEGEFKTISLLLNAWYDYSFKQGYFIYGGGGIGFSQITLQDFRLRYEQPFPPFALFDLQKVDDKDIVATGQICIGVGYKLLKNLIIDLSYRYYLMRKPSFKDSDKQDFIADYKLNSNNYLLRLKYLF
jgi:opacity protein-like surface antigen